jgi:hypothetical protein
MTEREIHPGNDSSSSNADPVARRRRYDVAPSPSSPGARVRDRRSQRALPGRRTVRPAFAASGRTGPSLCPSATPMHRNAPAAHARSVKVSNGRESLIETGWRGTERFAVVVHVELVDEDVGPVRWPVGTEAGQGDTDRVPLVAPAGRFRPFLPRSRPMRISPEESLRDQTLEGVRLSCSNPGNSEGISSVTQMEHNVAQTIQPLFMVDLYGSEADGTRRDSPCFSGVALSSLGYVARGSRPW